MNAPASLLVTRDHVPIRDFAHASEVYCTLRDASSEGASTWPDGYVCDAAATCSSQPPLPPPHSVALAAILECKGGPMRDRRERRPKDAGRGWRRDHKVDGVR